MHYTREVAYLRNRPSPALRCILKSLAATLNDSSQPTVLIALPKCEMTALLLFTLVLAGSIYPVLQAPGSDLMQLQAACKQIGECPCQRHCKKPTEDKLERAISHRHWQNSCAPRIASAARLLSESIDMRLITGSAQAFEHQACAGLLSWQQSMCDLQHVSCTGA